MKWSSSAFSSGESGCSFSRLNEFGDALLRGGGGLEVSDRFGRRAGRDEVDDFQVNRARRAHLVFSIQRKLRAVRILGIESSCDETAAAVVEDGSRILSSVVASQIATHARYGGVVPELASREHLRAIVPVVRLALEQSDTRLEESGSDRGHARSGTGGIAAGRDHLRQGARVGAPAAADRGESHRGAHSRGGEPESGGAAGAGAGGQRRAHASL